MSFFGLNPPRNAVRHAQAVTSLHCSGTLPLGSEGQLQGKYIFYDLTTRS